jgi:hypothetical protein
MTENEQEEFCLSTIVAARRMRIALSKNTGNGHIWFDPQAGVQVRCNPGKDAKESLLFACQSLVDWLCSGQAKTT